MAENAHERIRELERWIRQLQQENSTSRAQGLLFEQMIELAGTAPDQKLLKVSMQKTLEVTAQLSGAQTGSLFLLNNQGRVTDSLLTRGDVEPGLRSDLLGSVLDKGLAGWVRKNLAVGLIVDTRTDSRWLKLPEAPYSVRSALSVPIIRNKSLFGILTLMHPDPGHFDRDSVEIIRIAASQMALAIEMARLYIRLEELHRLRQKAMERDLQLARQVQESFLPGRAPEIDGYEFAALNRPAHEVGGDFYHFFKLPRNRMGIVLGDVSGKGIAAALFTVRLGSDLQYFAPLHEDPATFCTRLNAELFGRSRQGMFVTLVYMILDIESGRISFVNAGHLPPVYTADDGICLLGNEARKGIPLGVLPKVTYESEVVDLPENGGVMLYTDGVTEAKNRSSGLFGANRLKRIIRRYPANPDRLVRQVVRAVEKFSKGRDQSDDITLVGFRRLGKE